MPSYAVEFWRTVTDIEKVTRYFDAADDDAARAAAATIAEEFESDHPSDTKTDCGDSGPWTFDTPQPMTRGA